LGARKSADAAQSANITALARPGLAGSNAIFWSENHNELVPSQKNIPWQLPQKTMMWFLTI